MPIRRAMELIDRARSGGYAVGYFESWNLESLQGVIDAAEEARAPVLIGFNGEFMSRDGRLAQERLRWYAELGMAAAESARVPCGLIFNECSNDDWIRQAIDAGFSQVMPDDPAAERTVFRQRVINLTSYAHQKGVAVEAEVGRLPCGAENFGEAPRSKPRGSLLRRSNASGCEGWIFAEPSEAKDAIPSCGKPQGFLAKEGDMEKGERLTDPEEAASFVRSTGIDLLAVSVGNVHILLEGNQPLDMGQLERLRKRVDLPFDLHGGTGIPADSLRAAIRLGVAKVCYGTYLKKAYLNALRRILATEEPNPHKLLSYGGDKDLLVAGRLAVKAAVMERIGVLGCCGRA